MSDQTGLAERIRSLRLKAGLNQEEVAQGLREHGVATIHASGVARMERGERVLKFSEAFALASVLGVTVADLAGPDVEWRERLVLKIREARSRMVSAQTEWVRMLETLDDIDDLVEEVNALPPDLARRVEEVRRKSDRETMLRAIDHQIHLRRWTDKALEEHFAAEGKQITP